MHNQNPFSINPASFNWYLREAQKTPHKKVEDSIKQIIQEAISASCTIYVASGGKQWSGSGFHVGGGVIATAGHVVPQELASAPSQISVTFDGATLYPAKFLITDPNIDSGLIVCPPISRQINPVQLGDSDTAEVGDIIAAISSPEGWKDTATVGRISNTHQELGDQAPTPAWNDVIFIDADILQGSSGGMVIGTDGLVYGSVVGVTGQHAELGLGENAICPSNKIKTLLEQVRGR